MKKLKLIILLLLLFTIPSITTYADPPTGPGGNPEGSSDPPLGGGAPIGSGLIILLGLGTCYGGYKGFIFNNEKD